MTQGRKKTDLLQWLQRARLAGGLVLLVFVVGHFLNHALGLISLEAAEAGRTVFLAVWRNPFGTLVLYGAVAVHVVAAVIALMRRRSLKMRAGEAVQIIFGLAIPVFLVTHVIATRGAHEVFGVEDTYAYVVLSLWVWSPLQGVLQTAALLIVWTHGMLGLHFWWRLKSGYRRWQPLMFAAALLLPAAALAGFASAGQQVALLSQDQQWLGRETARMKIPPGTATWVYDTAGRARGGIVALVVLVLAVHGARWLKARRSGRVTVSYADGRSVAVPPGTSILEASRIGGIPHASVCGGRGRCSTCRVRVLAGGDRAPPPSDDETKVLRRVGASGAVRLACQLRLTSDIGVMPLLAPTAGPRDGFRRPGYLQGSEREIAVLFADLRAFTAFSETKLPFDVVFALNQYFRMMGEAVDAAGGRLDKFIGDGVMALFGIERGVDRGCLNALRAAREMALALDELNRLLAEDLDAPLRMGIGIHAGHAIVGEMGYRHAVSVTAIGDTVNTASRLEALSKECGVQLVVSADVVRRAGADLSAYDERQVEIRGRTAALPVILVPNARVLALPDDGQAQPAASASAAAPSA